MTILGWEEINSNIARNVREFRMDQNLSEEKLGSLINTSKSTISRIENQSHDKIVHKSYISKLASVFGVEPDVLTETNDELLLRMENLDSTIRSFVYTEQELKEAMEIVALTQNRGKREKIKAYHLLGLVRFLREEYHCALSAYESAIELAESSTFNYGETLHQLKRNQAEALLRVGEFDKLRHVVESEIPLISNQDIRAKMLFPLGVAHYKLGKFDLANRVLSQAIEELPKNENNRSHLARFKQVLAASYRKMPGGSIKSIEIATEALDLAEACGDKLCQIYSLRVIGEALFDQGKRNESKEKFSSALNIAEFMNNKDIEILLIRFSLELCQEDSLESFHRICKIIDEGEKTEMHKFDLAEMYSVGAEMAHNLGLYTESRELFRKALKTLQ